jgi:hypothetical protein
MIKRAKFKIEDIDLEQGLCTVRHINPYGPVESEEVDLEKIDVLNNPNHDILSTFKIPLSNYEFVENERLINYIARNYPKDAFDDYLMMKLAEKRQDLLELVNQTFEQDVEIPEDIPVGGLIMMPYHEGAGLDIDII